MITKNSNKNTIKNVIAKVVIALVLTFVTLAGSGVVAEQMGFEGTPSVYACGGGNGGGC